VNAITPFAWLPEFAGRYGFRYEAHADERWLRAFEPFITLRTPHRYEHALHATGERGSVSIARFVVSGVAPLPGGETRPWEQSCWVAFAQDERIEGRAAVTNDRGSVFAEPRELVPLPAFRTGDPVFDGAFASFADRGADAARVVPPSLRKLLLVWRTPVHAELRPGAFVVAPVALGADAASLAWFLSALVLFGDKAAKRNSAFANS
jgi:hypothetical protein